MDIENFERECDLKTIGSLVSNVMSTKKLASFLNISPHYIQNHKKELPFFPGVDFQIINSDNLFTAQGRKLPYSASQYVWTATGAKKWSEHLGESEPIKVDVAEPIPIEEAKTLKRGKAYSEYEDQSIRYGVENGKSDAEIAAWLGRTEKGISQRRVNLGIVKEYCNWTDSMNATLLTLIDTLNKSIKETADILGLSYDSVRSQLYKLHGGRDKGDNT